MGLWEGLGVMQLFPMCLIGCSCGVNALEITIPLRRRTLKPCRRGLEARGRSPNLVKDPGAKSSWWFLHPYFASGCSLLQSQLAVWEDLSEPSKGC